MEYIYIVGGLIGLILGGEYLVRGAVAIAQRFGISPMVIGLTLVGFGTSTPELLASVQAALSDAPGIAVGNVVGSNIANILLILGIATLITPIVVSATALKRDGSVLIGATALCAAVILYGSIGRLIGVGFLALLALYLVGTIYAGHDAVMKNDDTKGASPRLSVAALMMIIGLVATIFSAKFLVDGAITVATNLGISQSIIGLTIVAVGTSMPELVTSVIAARKGEVDVAIGNVIGSNIFNILGILGATALVKPMIIPEEIAGFDVWIMLGATLALCFVAISGWKITRSEGAALLLGYVAYISYMVTGALT